MTVGDLIDLTALLFSVIAIFIALDYRDEKRNETIRSGIARDDLELRLERARVRQLQKQLQDKKRDKASGQFTKAIEK